MPIILELPNLREIQKSKRTAQSARDTEVKTNCPICARYRSQNELPNLREIQKSKRTAQSEIQESRDPVGRSTHVELGDGRVHEADAVRAAPPGGLRVLLK